MKMEMEGKNELQVFEKSGLGKLTIIQINDEDVFNLSDVCFGLGYTRNNSIGKPYLRKDDIENICNALSIYGINLNNEKYKILKIIDFENTYITLDNMIILAKYSKAKYKYKFALYLENRFNIAIGDFQLADNFIPIIKEALLIFNPIEEYNVLNYKIDLYFPYHKIAIECDEYCHKDNILEDGIRQEDIEKELGCKFIRFEPRKDLNVGIVINNILKEILKEEYKI